MTATTFDPGNIGVPVLSGGNLTMTPGTPVGMGIATRACTRKTYCEFVIGGTFTSTSLTVGLGSRGLQHIQYAEIGGGIDGNCSVAYEHGGTVTLNGTTIATLATWTVGNTICMAFDPATMLVWFRVGSGNWNNNVSGDPVAEIAGISISAMNGWPLYPSAGGQKTVGTPTITGVFSSGSFSFTVPTGYNSVDTPTFSNEVNGLVASRSASFTQYGATKKITPSSPNLVASTQAQRGFDITNAWYGGQQQWSPAGVETYGSGTVAEGATLVAGKTVYLYDFFTGKFLGSDISKVTTGAFKIPALGRSKIFAVALDPTTYQAICFDDVTPHT